METNQIKYQMNKKLLLLVLLMLFYLCGNSQDIIPNVEKVNADSLINHVENYLDKKIEIEGSVVHVCGVDGKKIKLKTKGGEIIKIVPLDSTLHFDKSYNGKTVIVQGKITQYKLEKVLVDSLEKAKTLLCHIDNSPCKDKEWIEYQISKGIADSISKKDIERLREKMLKTRKDYVFIIILVAEKIMIKDEEQTNP